MFYTQSNSTEVRFNNEPFVRVKIPYPEPFLNIPNVVVTPLILEKDLSSSGIITTLVSVSETEFVVDLSYFGNRSSDDFLKNIQLNWLAQCWIPEEWEDKSDEIRPEKSSVTPEEGGDLTQDDIKKIREILKHEKITADSLTQMLDRINATHELIMRNMR